MNGKNQQAIVVLAVCLITDLLLICLYSTHLIYEYIPNHLLRFFNPDAELSVPTWFSSVKLGLAGGFLLYFASDGKYVAQKIAGAALGFVTLFLSLDEAVGIHEHIGILLSQVWWFPRFNANHGAWIAPYMIVAVVYIAVFYKSIRALYKLQPKAVTFYMTGLLVFIAAAAGLEIMGYLWFRNTTNTVGYMILTMIEELFELIGASLMLYGALLLACFNNDPGV